MLIRSRKWLTGPIIGALALGMFGGGYLALFHTSLPLRAIASLVSRDDRINVEGVSGSVAKGFHVERVKIHDDKRPASQIEDLSFQYRGSGWGQDDRVVIDEARVGKATVYVNVNPAAIRIPAAFEDGRTGSQQRIDSPSKLIVNPSSPMAPISLLEIKRLLLNQLVIRDPTNAFELTLPKIEWTGFQIQKGKISPGSVTSNSDQLDLQTLPGESVQVDGEFISFQKRLLATIKPGLHPAIREVIDADVDLSLDLRGLAVVRVRAFQQTFEAFHSSNHSGYVRCNNLDLAEFIEVKPFVLPNQIKLDLSYAVDLRDRVHTAEVHSGSFLLGTVAFEIEPQKIRFNERDTAEAITIFARGKDREREYAYSLAISASEKPLLQTITSNPPLPAKEILARVLYGKPLSELTWLQLAELEQQLPRYTQIASKLREPYRPN